MKKENIFKRIFNYFRKRPYKVREFKKADYEDKARSDAINLMNKSGRFPNLPFK